MKLSLASIRFQLVEEALQQHALQNGAVEFLEDIAGAKRPAESAADDECLIAALEDERPQEGERPQEEELVELHGPCDRFAAPPAPVDDQMPDRPEQHGAAPGRDGYWYDDGQGDEDGQGEVSGPPAEEDPEPTTLESEPCGEAPPAGRLSVYTFLANIQILNSEYFSALFYVRGINRCDAHRRGTARMGHRRGSGSRLGWQRCCCCGDSG